MKVTITQDDGSTVELFDQAHVDAAVKAAAAPATPAVDPEATEVDIVLTDGTTKTFVPKA